MFVSECLHVYVRERVIVGLCERESVYWKPLSVQMPIGQKERKPKVGTLFKSDKMTKEREKVKNVEKNGHE